MIVINLYGAPSSGKSAMGLYIAAMLKRQGYNIEYVPEFAKELVYSREDMSNQMRITAGQYTWLKTRADYGVQAVVTDSPLLIGLIYFDQAFYKSFKSVVKGLSDEFENVNILVKRSLPYEDFGRNESEEESDAIHKEIEGLLENFDLKVNGDNEGAERALEYVKSIYKK